MPDGHLRLAAGGGVYGRKWQYTDHVCRDRHVQRRQLQLHAHEQDLLVRLRKRRVQAGSLCERDMPHATGRGLQERDYRDHIRGDGNVQRRDLQLCTDGRGVRHQQDVRRSGRVR